MNFNTLTTAMPAYLN